ncbi:MAG: CPBP family glutamic-type intramembrane protease, partial [Planctomycetota bacterium]
ALRFDLVEELPCAQQLTELVTPILKHASGSANGLSDNARRESLRLIREAKITEVLVVGPAKNGVIAVAVLADEANSRLSEVRPLIDHATDAWKRELIERSLHGHGVDIAVLKPLHIEAPALAPIAETVRTHVAGLIPYILVMLATMAAFHPAIDLMAGERERGTLETLLSLPMRRRNIVIGKLLVVGVSALVAILCNLLSLGLSVLVMGSQLLAATGNIGIDLTEALSMGVSTLALCFLVLSPLVVAIAALAIGLSGFAASVKEAQTWLTPLILAVMFSAIVVLEPSIRPSYPLDLVPITGAVLALKEALQSPTIPWDHLVLSTLASLAVAVVIVGWCTQLLEQERFRYPGLVRAGWGRWRKWWPPNGRAAHAPTGPEVLIVYAVAVAGMVFVPGFLINEHPVVLLVLPLILCVAGPALTHAWMGAYDARKLFSLRAPQGSGIAAAVLLLPLAVSLSFGLGALQSHFVDAKHLQSGEDQFQQIFQRIGDLGGLPLLILCAAVAPGICEELLCRGTLLTGLRRSAGPAWAVIISAFLFAVLHGSPLRFMPQMMLGILLALITLRSGSIIPAMIIHAGHNALVISLSFIGMTEPSSTLVWSIAIAALPLGYIGWRLADRTGKPAA